jgi:hypothetical protein
VLGLLGATVLLTQAALAQPAATLSVGARVRVTASTHELQRATGQYVGRRGDTLVVRLDSPSDAQRQVPVVAVERLDVQQGRAYHTGIRVGGLIGMLLGGGVTYAVSTPCDQQPGLVCDRAITAMSGALVGAVVGSVVGARGAPER